jgi:exonuclease SbcD
MKCKFLHLSDIHLGYQQYNLNQRFNDFGHTFLHIVDRAISERVDFVILGGDLFQKRTIDPPTLTQAIEGLGRLKEVGIPVAAVEGNHERAHYRDVFSWMDFLASQGYLALLNPVSFKDGIPALTAWDEVEGSYLEPLKGIRIYGIKYYGAMTDRVVKGLVQALSEMDHSQIEYVILVMHAGLEGVLPNYSATLTHSQIAPLRDYVDYLALGHIHKPFEREGWIFNPGSPETCSIDEAAWPNRGYYLVEVNTTPSDGAPKHLAQLVTNPRRPFLRLSLSVDPYQNPEALYTAAEGHLRQEAAQYASNAHNPESTTQPLAAELPDGVSHQAKKSTAPMVNLTLEGVLPFARHELDVKRLEALIEDAFHPLLARVNNRTVPTEYEVSGDETKPRAELEREVVEDLVERDARYQRAAADWTQIILNVKRMSLEGTSPEGLVDYLESANRRVTESAPD